MLKIKLFFQIRKFYKIFGSEVGSNFITKLSDMTADNLYDVLFDINEVLEANSYCFCEEAYEMDAWLNDLYDDIETYRHDKTPLIAKILGVICALLILWAVVSTVEVTCKNLSPNPQYSIYNLWTLIFA